WYSAVLPRKASQSLPTKVRRQRNRRLADAAPGMVRWQLEYKTSWRGTTFFKGEPTMETGKTCSACGWVRAKPVLPTLELFTCYHCGLTLDRRVNSARVIKRIAGGELRPG